MIPAKWGFPTDTSRLLINARVETVAKRPAFRDAYRGRRCLVPADGFYEWRHQNGRRGEPFWYHHADGSLLLMAGIYQHGDPGRVPKPPRDELRSAEPSAAHAVTAGAHPAFTILTMPANDVVAPAHDRMPVVLSPEGARAWLDDPRFDPASSAARPHLGRGLVATPVSTRVNSAAYDGPECLSPPDPAPPTAQLEFPLSRGEP